MVVFGHTHLPKAIVQPPPKKPGQFNDFSYFNTGTWADVIEVPAARPGAAEPGGPLLTGVYKDDHKALTAFVDSLRDNQLERYVRSYLSYVEVQVDPHGDVAEAQLRSYCGSGREREPPLSAYPRQGPAAPAAAAPAGPGGQP